jgi:LysM repeat protein
MTRSLRLLGAALLGAVVLAAPATAHVHTVQPGETLSGIAAANGLPTGALAAANGLSPTAFVISGSRLQVPAPGGGSAQPLGTTTAPTPGAGSGGHLVQPGETLSGIAAANGLTTAALAGANGLSPTAYVISGTRLRIPAAGAPTEATGTPAAPSRPAGGGYVVRPGDTLSELALRNRVPIAQVASLNGLRPDSFLIAGTSLRLPGASPVAAPAPSVAAPAPAPAVQAGGRVTSSDIHRIAGEHGVPGSLAAAIGWQESGFNNAMVSSTNARGVMQVMPGTWREVQSTLAGGRALNPASAADNVRAGALYLGHLLRQTNGDPAMAAAAYYQGLSSVRRIGMLPETRRYVANVLALRGRFGG